MTIENGDKLAFLARTAKDDKDKYNVFPLLAEMLRILGEEDGVESDT